MATTYQIIRLASPFYIGGLPNSVRVGLNPALLFQLDYKMNNILKTHPTTIYDNAPHATFYHDLFILVDDYYITIIKPNHINSKQTLKSSGIIVCKHLDVYKYNISNRIWECQTLEK